MPFPSRLLGPGEEVVLEAHPHWSLLVPRAFVTLLVLAGCVTVVVIWGSAPIWVAYVLAAVGVVAIGAFLAKLVSWRSALLVVTTSRIIYRSGLVRRVGREIPLRRVQDVTYRQTLVERLLGAGSLTIESAGRSGEEPFPDIRRPAHVQSVISQLLSGAVPASAVQPPPAEPKRSSPQEEPPAAGGRRDGGRVSWRRSERGSGPGGDAAPGGAQPSATRSVGAQLDELAQLHRAGVITDAEFEAKKQELLGLL